MDGGGFLKHLLCALFYVRDCSAGGQFAELHTDLTCVSIPDTQPPEMVTNAYVAQFSGIAL